MVRIPDWLNEIALMPESVWGFNGSQFFVRLGRMMWVGDKAGWRAA